jgi:hypothetical protein
LLRIRKAHVVVTLPDRRAFAWQRGATGNRCDTPRAPLPISSAAMTLPLPQSLSSRSLIAHPRFCAKRSAINLGVGTEFAEFTASLFVTAVLVEKKADERAEKFIMDRGLESGRR